MIFTKNGGHDDYHFLYNVSGLIMMVQLVS